MCRFVCVSFVYYSPFVIEIYGICEEKLDVSVHAVKNTVYRHALITSKVHRRYNLRSLHKYVLASVSNFARVSEIKCSLCFIADYDCQY